jgi:hypothetical protein
MSNNTVRSNVLVRVARRIAAIGSEISYAQHRLDEFRLNPVGK